MRTVRDIPKLDGIPVLVRAALNVPVKDGKVAGAFRLRRALSTIEFLRARHARVILVGHIGDQGTESLEPVFHELKKHISGLAFCPVVTGPIAREMARNLGPGEVLMLENVRREAGEKKNSPELARSLAELADVFVQDSFDVCHRAHASVVGVPEFLPSYAGFLVEEEVRELTKALRPAGPSLAIIGGAKFATKEPVLVKLLAAYDRVFVGGALANDFALARGLPVGRSLVSGADPKEMKTLLGNQRLALPLDYVVAPMGRTAKEGRLADVRDVAADEAILDDGPRTVEMLAERARRSKTILWNGPVGNYENGFVTGTESLARVIAASSAHSVVGGGDTVAAIEALGISDQFSFISTGGGAMLDFLATGSLPGLDALAYP